MFLLPGKWVFGKLPWMKHQSNKCFNHGNLGFLECKHMLLGLCNSLATFQKLMQNHIGELNLTYYLIYLDNVTVFSKTEEEHLKYLHVMFDHFQEHNLRLKPIKYEFYWNDIYYKWVPLKPDFLRAWKSVWLKCNLAYPIIIISLIIQGYLAKKSRLSGNPP